MIQRVIYREEHYDTPVGCVSGIRELVSLGWIVVEVRGAKTGPFMVLCRWDELS
ncbi:MAG: hypothetical protein WBO97_03255 [Tepidiformaceae bacterium]